MVAPELVVVLSTSGGAAWTSTVSPVAASCRKKSCRTVLLTGSTTLLATVGAMPAAFTSTR
jgi:hypothetical protein